MHQPDHTTEPQVIGEADRRRAEEREALESAASMTVAEMKAQGLDDGPVADLKTAAKAATGKARPTAAEVARVGEDLPETERVAIEKAVNPAESKETTP